MGFKRGVMYRISAEIDNALPAFIKSSRDCEYDEVFELIDASWVSGDWVVLLSYGERLSHYALSERRLLEDSNLDNLSKFCQRLWLLGTHDVFGTDKSKFESLYSPEIVDDLNHIVTSQNRITLLIKIRAINTLNTVLQTLRQNVPTVWEVNSLESHQYLCERFRFISIDVLLQVFNNYLEAPPVGTSYQRRKAFISSMVRLAAAMRHIWLFRDDLGGRLVEAVLGDISQIDLRSTDIFFKFRLILLMCPNSTLYRLYVEGELFKWWTLVNEDKVNFWNSMMICFVVRALKFGWATGNPYITEAITERLPYLFHILYSAMGIPNMVTVVKYKESVPGEFTVLLEKPLNLCKKFGKILSYLLFPLDTSHAQDGSFSSSIMEYVTALVSAVYPYTHPSNGGKWSSNIAIFVRQFILGYTRRICRERATPQVVSCATGIMKDGRNLHLTRPNDEAIVELFYPLVLQGMYSKNVHVAYSYEDALKRLCYMLPDKTLVSTLDHLVLSSESVTEPHQMLGALRLFAQLTPLILTFTPQALLPLLDIVLKGIDASDPFKTGQTLTLVNVIFSHLPCRDLTDVDISDAAKTEIVKSMYLKLDTKNSDVETTLNNLELEDSLVDIRPFMFQPCDSMTVPDDTESNFSREMVILHTTNNLEEAMVAFDALLNMRKYITQNLSCWCQEWFAAMLQLAENSCRPNSGSDSLMNAVDMGTYILTRSALVTVLCQTDSYTLRTICETFFRWVCDNAFRKDALKYMVAIATSLSYANSAHAMELVFDKLFAKFKREVEMSVGGVCETQLIWYIGCFSGLVRRSNVYLIPRLEQLRYILKVGFGDKSKGVFKMTAKFLQRCIDTLVGVYFVDLKCVNHSDNVLDPGLLLWDLPWFARNAQFRKGKCDLSHISDVNWHIPSDAELCCAMELSWHAMNLVTSLTKDVVCMETPSKPENHTALNIEVDPSFTTYVKLSRACTICKNLLRGLKHFAVDDRDTSVKGLPKVSPVDWEGSRLLQQFVLDFVMTLVKKFGSIEATNDLMVTKIFCKLLKVIDEYLCRDAVLHDSNPLLENGTLVGSMKQESHVGTTVTAGSTMLAWMSFYHDINNKGFWQDAPRVTWLLMLHERYYDRLNLRKMGHECIGQRRELLDLVLQCSVCQYKDVSGYAQQLVKPLTSVHYGIKSYAIEYILDRGNELCPRSQDGCSRSLEGLSCIPDILSVALVKRIINQPYLFSKCCKFLLGVVLTAPNKDSLMSKYDNLLLSLLNCREHCPPTAITEDTMTSILESLFDDNLKNVQAATHWRFQLYATALLVSFRHLIPSTSVGRYVTWLFEVSDYKTKHPCVVTVALFGLYRCLSDTEFYQYIPAKLWKPEYAAVMLNSLCAINHDTIKQNNSSTVKQSNSIVTSVIKLDRTWPRNRISCNSKAFSMQNYLVAYHYFVHVFENGYVDVIQGAISVLTELSSSPPTVFENHCAFAEISAALMKASLRGSDEMRVTFWNLYHPIFKTEMENLVLDRIADFMDAIRLALYGCEYSRAACIPIYNLGINFNAAFSIDKLHPCELNNTSTNLVVVKQLKLYQALLQQVTTQCPDLFETLCNGILTEYAIFNDSLQVVDEVGYLCSFMVSLCLTYNELFSYKDRVHNCVAQLVENVATKGCQDDKSELSIKGLLSVIGLLYSMSLPVQDLGHNYTSQFLEFCLRFTASSNPSISDVATRAVHNIAMSPYYSRGNLDTVESIVRTLENTCKAQSNKTKVNSIQVAMMLQRNLCMYLRNTNVVLLLLEMFISALYDRQVRDDARSALTSITMSVSDDVHLQLTERFYGLVKNNNCDIANAGVLGLAALVATSPYHVPQWLPHTLTTLASCGASRFPDTVRRTVQKTLQDFFKSHMDAWSRVHVHKFSREQLETLELYKGCPTYFN